MSAKQTPENFWSKIEVGAPDQCWNWSGSKTSAGYGNLSWHGVCVQAHRVAFWLTNGGDGAAAKFRRPGWAKKYRRFVLHRCDNRTCCNPKHLFLGSMSTNLKDAYQKGRKAQPKSKHSNAKLSEEDVRSIRSQYAAGGVRQEDLAKQFGVTQRVISLVTRNETYKDVV